ncbi:34241_t:CDS:10, partial [Gigaspora margarita]
ISCPDGNFANKMRDAQKLILEESSKANSRSKPPSYRPGFLTKIRKLSNKSNNTNDFARHFVPRHQDKLPQEPSFSSNVSSLANLFADSFQERKVLISIRSSMTSKTPQVEPTFQVEPTPQAKPTTLHRNLMRNRERITYSIALAPNDLPKRKEVLNTYYVPDESKKPPQNFSIPYGRSKETLNNSAGCKLASFRKVLISIRSSMTSETPQVEPTSQVEPTPQAKPTTLHRNLMRNRDGKEVLNTYYVPDESGLEEYTKEINASNKMDWSRVRVFDPGGEVVRNSVGCKLASLRKVLISIRSSMTSETPQVEPTPQAKPKTLHRNLMRNRESLIIYNIIRKASVPLPPPESRFQKSAKLARSSEELLTFIAPAPNDLPKRQRNKPNIVISNSAGCKLASFRKVLIPIRSSMTSETPQVEPTSQVEPTPQAKPTTLHRNLMRNRESLIIYNIIRKASVPLPPPESRFQKSAKLARNRVVIYASERESFIST